MKDHLDNSAYEKAFVAISELDGDVAGTLLNLLDAAVAEAYEQGLGLHDYLIALQYSGLRRMTRRSQNYLGNVRC